MTRSLVIGGNGFIGAPLSELLLSLGHEVAIYDRFSRALPRTLAGNVELIKGSFSDSVRLREAVMARDHVFHFLSATTPLSSKTSPLQDLELNVTQTLRLLEYCVDAGVKQFTFASSGGTVYGNSKRPASENLHAAPISPYGINKLATENYLMFYRRHYNLDTCVLRISNPYGIRQREDRNQGLIPIVLRRIRNGEPVVRMGNGHAVRDYLYMDDLIEMIRRIVSGPRSYGVYNLGSGRGHSVNEILDIVRHVTGRDFEIIDVPAPAEFVDRIVLDTRRFESEYGRIEQTELHDGISRVWDDLEYRIS